jgi:hypothetical protein
MATERLDTRPPYTVSSWGGLSWGSIIAGALFAAALACILHSFAAAIGLGIISVRIVRTVRGQIYVRILRTY